ncbi:WYL domain-containing protein [Pseudoalteromonas fenneropenaei]|uniref:WYL domain-containing protein n=1 Tax=Pseudoalteromonas fenneropenaei TaxID=1737459 RepID=A0ABV7CPG8_9GAMM
MKKIEELSHAQRERLAFIDFRLCFIGEISRQDLIDCFQTGSAAATRDFASYKEFADSNLKLIHNTKSYHRTDSFIPLFEHDIDMVLTSFSKGFSYTCNTTGILKHYNTYQSLTKPSLEILATLMPAICRNQVVKINYISLTSGLSEREIVPHSLANNGNRWHVRGFDRQSNTFRDFVITRIQNALLVKSTVILEKETSQADKQWNRIVDLTLIPHPKAPYPQAIELDYNMEQGTLKLECRAALVGYLLNQWQVDCSVTHSLCPQRHHLALKEQAAIFGVESASLAPGYQETQS